MKSRLESAGKHGRTFCLLKNRDMVERKRMKSIVQLFDVGCSVYFA